MKRVIRTSLTIAMATVMIGFAVTQARADRVSYTVDRCFGAGCVAGSVRIGELSLAFTDSGLGVVDSAASATALANFSPELRGISGVSFAGSSVKAQSGDASPVQRASNATASPGVSLPVSGMSWSFSRLQDPAFATSIDLGRSVSTASNGSFSLTDASLNKTLPRYSPNGFDDPGHDDGGGKLPPGGAPGTPEPTTMLLLGTGLAGAAAVARRRLKGRKLK